MPPAYYGVIIQLVEDEARPVDKFGHQPRLENLTRQIGKSLAYDHEIVFAAAWLHDLGVFAGNRPANSEQLAQWDHVAYACSRAPQILVQAGFPPGKIPAVLDAIRQHQPRDEPATLEAIILRDADMLEQLGAIGILRTVSKVGRDTRFPRFADAIAVLHRNLDQLPARIRLSSTRDLAKPRILALQNFLAAVKNECDPGWL